MLFSFIFRISSPIYFLLPMYTDRFQTPAPATLSYPTTPTTSHTAATLVGLNKKPDFVVRCISFPSTNIIFLLRQRSKDLPRSRSVHLRLHNIQDVDLPPYSTIVYRNFQSALLTQYYNIPIKGEVCVCLHTPCKKVTDHSHAVKPSRLC
jgi:hypothetical protein